MLRRQNPSTVTVQLQNPTQKTLLCPEVFNTLASHCPESMFLPRHLRDASSFSHVSFVVGCFPDFFSQKEFLTASSTSKIRHFLTLECFWHFREKGKSFRQSRPAVSHILKNCGVGPQSIHTFVVTFVWLLVASDEYAYCIPNLECNLSTPRLRFGVPKINNMSAEQLCRATLLLLLPYKRPCHH